MLEGEQPTTSVRVHQLDFVNLKEDPSAGDFPLGQWLKLQVLQSTFAFPIDDRFVSLADEDVAHVMDVTRLKATFSVPNVRLQDPQSDEALAHIAFFGLGSHRLEQVQAPQPMPMPPSATFQVNLMAMADLEVRPGFARYRACAYFDAERRPVAIGMSSGELVRPGDGEPWEHAKFAWRCSLVCCTTCVDHLANVHFFVAAHMLRAVVTALPKDHVIQRAIHPFTFCTALINNKAGSALLPANAIISHISALTWQSFGDIMEAGYRKGPEWRPLPAQLADKGPMVAELVNAGALPYFEDGLCHLPLLLRKGCHHG